MLVDECRYKSSEIKIREWNGIRDIKLLISIDFLNTTGQSTVTDLLLAILFFILECYFDFFFVCTYHLEDLKEKGQFSFISESSFEPLILIHVVV